MYKAPTTNNIYESIQQTEQIGQDGKECFMKLLKITGKKVTEDIESESSSYQNNSEGKHTSIQLIHASNGLLVGS